jgi:hypothetical protein
MQVCTNLTCDGDCEEAFTVYARILGATLTFSLRYGDSPMAAQVVPARAGDTAEPARFWQPRRACSSATSLESTAAGGGIDAGSAAGRRRTLHEDPAARARWRRRRRLRVATAGR